MTGTPPRSPGRPRTGQKTVRSFRPPDALWVEFIELAEGEGRGHSDALIEAVHDWVKKKRRATPAAPPP